MMPHLQTQHSPSFAKYCFLILLLFAVPVSAVIEQVKFDDPALESRYYDLIAELRCLVCQNQNLADSDADLAKDLRRKTLEMLNAGQSDQQILDYMRERYGDFVLYKPPLSLSTALLWLGPFILLIGTALAILLNIKRRQSSPVASNEATDSKANKARDLMSNSPSLTDSATTTKEPE